MSVCRFTDFLALLRNYCYSFYSLLAEVSHDEAKMRERRETSAGFRPVFYHACVCVSLTTSDVYVTCDTTHRTGLHAKLQEVEGDRGTGGRENRGRENRGREGYGRLEEKGREAGSLRWREAGEKFKKAVKETNPTTFLDFHLPFSEA